jgi:four helix bundle protein
MEIFGLTGQMRRASASIGMNIVEGRCRKGDAEMAGFPQIAWDRQANLNTNFCSLMILSICTTQRMSVLQRRP